jgi:hypothetical protein
MASVKYVEAFPAPLHKYDVVEDGRGAADLRAREVELVQQVKSKDNDE